MRRIALLALLSVPSAMATDVPWYDDVDNLLKKGDAIISALEGFKSRSVELRGIVNDLCDLYGSNISDALKSALETVYCVFDEQKKKQDSIKSEIIDNAEQIRSIQLQIEEINQAIDTLNDTIAAKEEKLRQLKEDYATIVGTDAELAAKLSQKISEVEQAQKALDLERSALTAAMKSMDTCLRAKIYSDIDSFKQLDGKYKDSCQIIDEVKDKGDAILKDIVTFSEDDADMSVIEKILS